MLRNGRGVATAPDPTEPDKADEKCQTPRRKTDKGDAGPRRAYTSGRKPDIRDVDALTAYPKRSNGLANSARDLQKRLSTHLSGTYPALIP